MAGENSRDTSFFDSIKEQVPLEDYLRDHCSVEFVSDGPGKLAACCPFHEERTPSFKIHDSAEHDWQVWQCFGACASSDISYGTIIDAVMKHEGFDEAMDAARYLNEEYDLGLRIDTEAFKRFEELRQKSKTQIESARKELVGGDSTAAKTAKNYFASRGYTDEVSEHFKLGVDTEMTKAGRLSIPLYDKENHAVSVDGRALYDSYNCRACGESVSAKTVNQRRRDAEKATQHGKKVDFDWKACPHCNAPDEQAKISWLLGQYPKYRFQANFGKSKFLYHQFEAKRALIIDNRLPISGRALLGLFLVEGYADCWAGWQSGQRAICSYNGAVLSPWQARNVIEVALNSGDSKPIILVPDMDATGILNVQKNIDLLRATRRTGEPALEIQVVMGIDSYHYTDSLGVENSCKDLGEVLQYVGIEAVQRLLLENRRPAEEWTIRNILDAKLSDGVTPFHTRVKQMEMIGQVLQDVKHKASLDYLIPVLAEYWQLTEKNTRAWFQMNHSRETTASHQQLIADIYEARTDAENFLKYGSVIPIGYAAIDRHLPRKGVRKGWLSMFLGKSGTGKALSLDSKLLTPTGWKFMKDIAVGDKLVDPSTGGTTRVSGVYPQGKRDLYRVTFFDGASVECDREHLWTVLNSNKKWQVRTLGSIDDKINLKKSRFYIPLTSTVEFEDNSPLPLDPYLLGAILGDGDLTNGNVIFSNIDEEIISDVGERLPDGVVAKKIEGDNCMWGLTQGYKTSHSNPLTLALKELGLMGLSSPGKFIPKSYLFSSSTNRLKLLRGLMDTDGSVSVQSSANKGNRGMSVNVEFSSASRQLADDIIFLVRSFGGTARLSVGTAGYKGTDGEYHSCLDRCRVNISLPPEINPFKVDRKARKYVRRLNPTRRIKSIEFSRRAEAQCIAVDSEKQLYITDDFIVTHNTMMATQLLANMLEDPKLHAIMFSLEQKKGQLYERMACQILGRKPEIVEDLILAADKDNPNEVDKKTQTQARELLKQVDAVFGNENLFIVDNVPTETIDAVEMSAERVQAIISEINMTKFKGTGADVVIIDHLSILKPGPEAPRNVQNDEMQAAGYIMERLFQVCKAADVFMLVLQQLPKDVPAGVAFAKDAGRGGSKQTDYCDLIFGAWRPEQEIGLEEDDLAQRKGHYKFALLKNRYGAEDVAHLFFDTNSLRIVPAARAAMPNDDIADRPRVEIPTEGSAKVLPAPSVDPLIMGLEEEGRKEPTEPIDMHKLAAELDLEEEEGEGGELNAWEWN